METTPWSQLDPDADPVTAGRPFTTPAARLTQAGQAGGGGVGEVEMKCEMEVLTTCCDVMACFGASFWYPICYHLVLNSVIDDDLNMIFR